MISYQLQPDFEINLAWLHSDFLYYNHFTLPYINMGLNETHGINYNTNFKIFRLSQLQFICIDYHEFNANRKNTMVDTYNANYL